MPPTDILIVVDGSLQPGGQNPVNEYKTFLSNLTDSFMIGPNDTQVLQRARLSSYNRNGCCFAVFYTMSLFE